MPEPLVLPIHAGLMFEGNRVTDHNRSPLSINSERKENRNRMADATLRSFVVAKKRNIKVSWKDLPAEDIKSADGFWAAESIENFYESTLGNFTLRITYGDNTYEEIEVMFKDFSKVLTKRSKYTRGLYDIDITLEEV